MTARWELRRVRALRERVVWKGREPVGWTHAGPSAWVETLIRRVGYGGRKGRAAARRLRRGIMYVSRSGQALWFQLSGLWLDAAVVWVWSQGRQGRKGARAS